MRAVKGHGTGNDFIVVPDLDGALDLPAQFVRALCDRHTGVGADGVLRVVRSENAAESKGVALEAPFFMDYRNADGSAAEMCGNGVRVFFRYLQAAGLAGREVAVATRGGVRPVRDGEDGAITVEMGRPQLLAVRPEVTVAPLGTVRASSAWDLPNPHVVVRLDHPEELDRLELQRPPAVVPPLPHGQNVEVVTRVGPRRLRMRVHERGVGETLSCGTGICAAALDAAVLDGTSRDERAWQVEVPGGTCSVTWRADDEVLLSGPAVLVAEVDIDPAWAVSVGQFRG